MAARYLRIRVSCSVEISVLPLAVLGRTLCFVTGVVDKDCAHGAEAAIDLTHTHFVGWLA